MIRNIARALWFVITGIATIITLAGLIDNEVPLELFKGSVVVLIIGTITLIALFQQCE